MEAWRQHLLAGTFLVACTLAVLSYASRDLASNDSLHPPEIPRELKAGLCLPQPCRRPKREPQALALGVITPLKEKAGAGEPHDIANVSSKLSQVPGATDRSVEEPGTVALLPWEQQ